MSLQYDDLRPTNGWDQFSSLEHPSKFQRVSRLGFVTAPTSPNGSQPNCARCLAVSWAATLSMHFWGLLPPNGTVPGQTSLCVQVLRAPILAALLHGTRAVGVSQTLWRGIFSWQGGHPVRNWVVELSSFNLSFRFRPKPAQPLSLSFRFLAVKEFIFLFLPKTNTTLFGLSLCYFRCCDIS